MMWEDVGIMWESPPWEHLHEAPTFWSPHGGVCECVCVCVCVRVCARTEVYGQGCAHRSAWMYMPALQRRHGCACADIFALAFSLKGTCKEVPAHWHWHENVRRLCLRRGACMEVFARGTLACHQAEPSGALASWLRCHALVHKARGYVSGPCLGSAGTERVSCDTKHIKP